MRDEAFRSSSQPIHRLLCIFASATLLGLSIPLPASADLPGFLESAKLIPVDGAPEGGFGRAIAIDGDRAVVTANQGSFILDTTPEEIGAAAYVFERDAAGLWHQTAKLAPGLALRYQDAQNYHYITVRGSNTILLRKLVNGVPQTLDSASLPVTLNTWYRLRLEIIDQKLVVYVNNNRVLEATDPTLQSTGNLGRAALLTYKAVGQFDDFHVFGY